MLDELLKATMNDEYFAFQVSDIHVSRYQGYERAPDLGKFCDRELSIIQPELVIASGKFVHCLNHTLLSLQKHAFVIYIFFLCCKNVKFSSEFFYIFFLFLLKT